MFCLGCEWKAALPRHLFPWNLHGRAGIPHGAGLPDRQNFALNILAGFSGRAGSTPGPLPSPAAWKMLGSLSAVGGKPRGSAGAGTPSEVSFHPFVGLFLCPSCLFLCRLLSPLGGQFVPWEQAQGEGAPAWGNGVKFLNFGMVRAVLFPFCEERLRGGPVSPYRYFQGVSGDGARPFPVLPRDRTRSSSDKLKQKSH